MKNKYGKYINKNAKIVDLKFIFYKLFIKII